ncbi:DUF2478 domain-containing protein [Phaeovulum sp.]|uniref:DUF2478 domain-containing protein n=1 Tax=Phaeovulum sp. TaxID=2934796 RepID=UPI00272FE9D9|nr:DUF2478 domain-containing protein [Phaeovulum sp.]MDP1667861.1 DUF2478 domain-containing protein [Phaeovulum sp.]MDP2063879.1 DUF2478 domain-containing protein [Phaeovulum sp.]MDP3861678.1 DUF2478 domain-containing protein [Phaeovulum sp.]MDZ4120438.1 DUF2478 domain-containing protein [Phaeovulum sp.]
MHIAVVSAPERGQTDKLLAHLAADLMACGTRVVGVVQTNIERPESRHCDMDLRVLPAGPVLRISQNLGTASRGCRLNAEALETAVAAVERGLAEGADLLVVNRFGKHEAEGRGFRDLIATALVAGIPVICGISSRNRSAFDAFSDGVETAELHDSEQAMIWLGVVSEKLSAAG